MTLPAMTLRSAANGARSSGRTAMTPPESPLPA
jgi:hypothetical protein